MNQDMSSTYIKVPQCAAGIGGTSARLKANSYISVLNLLYGLMLPSGNDAAITLAMIFGQYIMISKTLSNKFFSKRG